MTLMEYSRSARHLLRTALKATHDRIEGGFDGLKLDAFDDYRLFLRVNAAALLPLEAQLSECSIEEWVPDWPLRVRTRAVRSDLQGLGVYSVSPMATPELKTFAELLGAAYVLEGSRLGARYLLGAVEASGDPRVRASTAFLRHGQGERFWPTFVAILNTKLASQSDFDIAVRGAEAAFGVFAAAQAALMTRTLEPSL